MLTLWKTHGVQWIYWELRKFVTHCSASAPDFYLFILSLFLCFVLLWKNTLWEHPPLPIQVAASVSLVLCLKPIRKGHPCQNTLVFQSHSNYRSLQIPLFHYCFWNSIRLFVCTHLCVKRWYYSAWQLDTCTKNKKRNPWGRKRQGREDASWLFFSFVTNSCCQEPYMQRGKTTRGFEI